MFSQIATYIMIGWFTFFLIGLALSRTVHRWLVKHRWAVDKTKTVEE